jgi:U3 small nucleolar RNA-associated protein 4
MVVSPPYLLPLPSLPLASSTKPKQVPILTSGGLDLSLIIVCASPALPPHASVSRSYILPNPVSESPSTSFETTIHRRAAYIPQRSKPFSVARDARLLVCRRDRSVGIWKVDQIKNGGREGIAWDRFRDEVEEEDESEGQEGWRKLVEMELKLQTNLVSSAVSNDGKWLAVSDLFETKLFRLQLVSLVVVPFRRCR